MSFRNLAENKSTDLDLSTTDFLEKKSKTSISNSKVVRPLSTFNLTGVLAGQPTPPPKHLVKTANKMPKKGGSKAREEKIHVVKELGLNPAYHDYMINQYHVDVRNQIEASDESMQLFIDAILQQYINIMNDKPFKTYVLSDDSREQLLGKASTFIPNLKTFGDLLYPKELFNEYHQVANELNKIQATSTHNDSKPEDQKLTPEQQNLADKMKELESQIKKTPAELFDVLKHPHTKNKPNTLASFADACVDITRLSIGDLHTNNIGIDGDGTVTLFDLEHGLIEFQEAWKQGKYRWFHTREDLKTPDYNTITQQPSSKWLGRIFPHNSHSNDIAQLFNLLDLNADDKNLPQLFKKHLGNNHRFFQKRIYRRWLKSILFPDTLLKAIAEQSKLPGYEQLTSLVGDYLVVSRERIETQLLKNPEFCHYLLTQSIQDANEIISEFEKVKKFHHRYFDYDQKLASDFIDDIRLYYSSMITTLQEKQVLDFIKGQLNQPKLSDEQEKQLLTSLKEAYAVEDEKSTQTRKALLQQAAKAFLQLVQHSDFDLNQLPSQKIIKTLLQSPNFMYKIILAGFYTNNDKALQILLPKYLQLRKEGSVELFHPVNQVDQFGLTLLNHAMCTSSLIAIQILMKAGARIDVLYGPGRPAILQTLYNGDVAIMTFLYGQYLAASERANNLSYLGKSMKDWSTLICKQMRQPLEFFSCLPSDGRGKTIDLSQIHLLKKMSLFVKKRLGTRELGHYEMERLNNLENKISVQRFHLPHLLREPSIAEKIVPRLRTLLNETTDTSIELLLAKTEGLSHDISGSEKTEKMQILYMQLQHFLTDPNTKELVSTNLAKTLNTSNKEQSYLLTTLQTLLSQAKLAKALMSSLCEIVQTAVKNYLCPELEKLVNEMQPSYLLIKMEKWLNESSADREDILKLQKILNSSSTDPIQLLATLKELLKTDIKPMVMYDLIEIVDKVKSKADINIKPAF